MDNYDEIETAIRLSRLKGVGASMFKNLLDRYKYPSKALEKWQEQTDDKRMRKVSLKKNETDSLVSKTVEAIKKRDFYAYYYGQKEYPPQLKVLSEPPPIVYVSSKIFNRPLAAVVGSRNASEEQLEKAKKITLKLINDGYAIVSGGAVGVDTIAHEAALLANAYTIAVLANGLDVVYPKSHRELFEKIRNNGCLMTELMLGAQPQKGFFPTRNRLIAALADIIVAFPTTESSGTLITAKWAKKLGKKLIIE